MPMCIYPSAVICAVLLLSSCSSEVREASAESTEAAAAPQAFRPAFEQPGAIMSRSGVVMPLISQTDAGYLVNTPCGNDAELTWAQPLRNIEVVLDPVEGGTEEGVTNGAIKESEINLAVAQQTANLLESRGISVALTRTGDYRVPIASRVAIVDALEPRTYVSIHHNSSPVEASDTPGSEVYPQTASPESIRLGGLVHSAVVDALSHFGETQWISASDAGVVSVLNESGDDAYGIVRGPEPPGVLTELSYLSNPSEADLIDSIEYQNSMAMALAAAISDFISNPTAQGSAPIERPRQFPVDNSTGGAEDCEDPKLA